MTRWFLGVLLLLLVGSVAAEKWLNGRAFSGQIPPPSDGNALAPSNNASPKVVEKIPRALPQKKTSDLSATSAVTVQRIPTPKLSQTKNVLLVGLDELPGQKYAGRPDTIVVAALSEKDGHLGLISIPRDLYVEIPGHGMDRINATFSVARSRNEASLDLLARVLSNTLKLPISHKIALNLSGFERVIDALGGVEVDVPCPITDNFLDSRTESGRRLLRVEAGPQHLDGITAGLYVRSRHGRSDFSRARRQQAVLFGIKQRFEQVAGLMRLPQFLEELAPLVTSDMTRVDLLGVARAATAIKPENIHGLVLGAKQAKPHYTEDGKAVLLPDFGEIDRSLSQLFSSALPGTRPELAPCERADIALAHRSKRGIRKTPDESNSSKAQP